MLSILAACRSIQSFLHSCLLASNTALDWRQSHPSKICSSLSSLSSSRTNATTNATGPEGAQRHTSIHYAIVDHRVAGMRVGHSGRGGMITQITAKSEASLYKLGQKHVSMYQCRKGYPYRLCSLPWHTAGHGHPFLTQLT